MTAGREDADFDFDSDIVVHDEPATARSYELDALSAILPPERRDRMAEVLTDDDVATLKHLAKEGIGRNTLRAIASDLNYLETWAHAALGGPLPWPATDGLVLKFIAHHLYDPIEREADEKHGMPMDVLRLLKADGVLRTDGPHAPSTVRRRIALWSTLHRWRDLKGPFASPDIRSALRLAVRAAARPRRRKSANAVTRDVLDQLLATCRTDSLVDLRDRALLLVAFASGGRRRSEIAGLRFDDIEDRTDVQRRPGDPDDPPLPCVSIRLGRTKTTGADEAERVLLIGRPVEALRLWLILAPIRRGAVFRPVDRFGRLGTTALDGQSVNAIVKKRCVLAELPADAFSAHGLRSGYLTEAARQGVPMQQAMQQSQHRSVQQASNYYNEVELERGEAARLG